MMSEELADATKNSSLLTQHSSFYKIPEHLGQVYILQRGGFFEQRGHLVRCIARYAATYGSDKEGQFWMLLGAGNKVLYGMFQRGLTLHGRQCVGAAGEPLTHSPFGAKMLVGKPCGTTAMGSMYIAAKDKNLVCAEVVDAV